MTKSTKIEIQALSCHNCPMIPQLIIIPETEERETYLIDRIKNLGLSNPHPDLLFLNAEEKLGIDKIKLVINHLSLKPFNSEYRAVVLVSADKLTPDAQNALLKITEEANEASIILLGVESLENILQTLTSRCQLIYPESTINTQTDNKYLKDIHSLTTKDIEERFKYVEKVEHKELFLQALVLFSRNKMKDDSKYLEFIKQLTWSEQLFKANTNQRAILEYLMQIMPNE